MTAAVFEVERAGPWTSIQDRGRPGHLRYGITESGPMDRSAFEIAGAASGNEEGAPAIEGSIGGLTLSCTEGSASFALTGGGFVAEIDGERIGSWCVTGVRKGQRLVVKPGRWGNWWYLAFAGEIETRSWLGSRSTHGPSGLGGGFVTAGSRLTVGKAKLRKECHRSLPVPISARIRHEIRVVLGPQDRFFSEATIDHFFATTFTLTAEYDRMGVKLEGAALPIEASLSMPSEPILRGSIQVPGHGHPIVLLADHQSTGGYPKIATLISADQDAFAQLKTRDVVHFRAVTPDQAIIAARIRQQAQAGYLEALKRWRGAAG